MKNIISKKEIDSIHKYCEEFEITKFNINPDGSVDIMQNVDITNQVTNFPFKLNVVHGNFTISNGILKNLKNMPNIVMGDFDISLNYIKSLEGCPHTIMGDFCFQHNLVETTFVGDYDVLIGGEISCHDNNFDLSLFDAISNHYDIDPEEDDIDDIEYNNDLIKLIFKYQRHFEIWSPGALIINEVNFNELLEEIKDGLK